MLRTKPLHITSKYNTNGPRPWFDSPVFSLKVKFRYACLPRLSTAAGIFPVKAIRLEIPRTGSFFCG